MSLMPGSVPRPSPVPKMHIFVNTDLRMGEGKTAAQVGHGVQLVLEHILEHRPPGLWKDYLTWKQTGITKIIHRATGPQVEALSQLSKAWSVHDAGHTQVAPGSLTVVAFAPTTRLHVADLQSYGLL